MLTVLVPSGGGPTSRTLHAPSASGDAIPSLVPLSVLPMWTVIVLPVVTWDVPSTRHSPVPVRNSTLVVVRTSAFGLICTVETSEPPGPVTVSWKISGSVVFGILKVGLATVVLDSVTAGPPVWLHWKLVAPVEAEPLRVTVSPTRTVWAGPAFATGGATGWTVTTVS